MEWDAIPAAFWQGQLNGYNIYHRIMHGLGPWKKSSTTQLSHTLKGKLLNEFYEFQVCGKTNAGEGLCSNVIAFRPQIPSAFLLLTIDFIYRSQSMLVASLKAVFQGSHKNAAVTNFYLFLF